MKRFYNDQCMTHHFPFLLLAGVGVILVLVNYLESL